MAILGKAQVRVSEGLDQIRRELPFELAGIDSDNGSEFINDHVVRYCKQEAIQFTRGRPYKKDHNAHIEQKNWTHVRRLMGWVRYDTERAVEAMNRLYRGDLRLLRLRGRQHLQKVLHVKLEERQNKLSLSHHFDQAALETLEREWLGRIVLVTDRDDWSTTEIIRAYRGHSRVEGVFAHLKDPVHVTLRPQFHWTDQKLHVHVFICLIAYLLARLLHLRASRSGYSHSMERLLDDLEQVRRVRVARRSATGKGSWRVTSHLDHCSPELTALLTSLGIPG